MSKIIPKTLLVVKNRAMGDAILSLSTLQYIREIHPDIKIIYGVPKWVAPLFKNTKICADEVIPLELKTMGDFIGLWKLLRKKKIDTVLELFQSGRTAKFFNLWKKLGGPRYFFHNHHKKVGDVYDQGIIKANIQRDLDCAWTFLDSKNTSPPSYLDYEPQMETLNNVSKKQVILGVVATRETKMWPISNYKKFIQLFLNSFNDHNIIIPLGPKDQILFESLSDIQSERCKIIKASLKELPSVLSGSKMYLGNDTGLKHICISLGIPSFTMFGPEPPLEWHPYNKEKHDYYYKNGLECRTRNAHYCGLSTCDSMICLKEFTPEDLLAVCRNNFLN